MYEGFFGLNKRPFSAVPNTDSFVGLESTQDALDDLLICVVQAKGIAVITSFAGLGKTLLCKKVAEVATGRFQTVFLSTSAFSTRRALLQAILYEFGIQYEGLTEQEARLKIMEAARAITKDGQRLLIIVDEAHLLNSRLFEELRTLTDYAPEGEALIRLILSGQFELEEKLADPAMSAIHQRIGCQVTLESLSLTDSATLIKERLRLAGAKEIAALLSESALEAICRASDGNARCLCQLADHSFLLAFAEEQKPVQRDSVLAALEDLKELPLHWNDLAASESEGSSYSPAVDNETVDDEEYLDVGTDEFIIPDSIQEEAERSLVLHLPENDAPAEEVLEDADIAEEEEPQALDFDDSDEIEYSVFEVGADIANPVETASEELDIAPQEEIETSADLDLSEFSATEEIIEEPVFDKPVFDKYAALDREREHAAEIVSQPQSSASDHVEETLVPIELEVDSTSASEFDAEEILETIEGLRQEIGSAVDDSKNRIAAHQSQSLPEDGDALDVVLPERVQEQLPVEVIEPSASEDVLAQPESDEQSGNHKPDEVQVHPADENSHRFAQLFTRLSQRRKRIKAQRISP